MIVNCLDRRPETTTYRGNLWITDIVEMNQVRLLVSQNLLEPIGHVGGLRRIDITQTGDFINTSVILLCYLGMLINDDVYDAVFFECLECMKENRLRTANSFIEVVKM